MWRCHRWCHSMSHADRRFWATEIRCAGNRPSVEAINSPEKIQYTLATRWCVNPHARLSYIDMHIPTKSYNYTQHINLSYINLIYIYIYISIHTYIIHIWHVVCVDMHSCSTLCPKSIAQNAQSCPEGGPVARAQGLNDRVVLRCPKVDPNIQNSLFVVGKT